MGAKASSLLFVTTSFPRFKNDFAGSFIYRFAKYLVRDGLQVTVLAPAAPGYPLNETIDGIIVHRFTYFLPRSSQCLVYGTSGILSNIKTSWLAKLQIPFLLTATVYSIIRHQDHFDLIHCHWLPTAIAAILARTLSRKKPPIVLTNWGSDTRLLPNWITRWTIQRVEGFISTAAETDEHLKAAGCEHFHRIMAPIDEERFDRTKVSTDLLRELKIRENTSVIPFIGRLDAFKDPLTFIRACALLRDDGISFVAPIAGDGDLMRLCRQEIDRLSLHDHVLLLGTRSDPERLLRVATVTVHISPIENTWANSIAEAMFMHVPVVLTDVGYTKKMFTDRKDCLIIPPENPNALKDALILLLNDEGLREQLASGANKLFRKYNKDSKSIVAQTRTYYDEIINCSE
jgi:glycosyltransferase involved in cell wall biosynthesis